MELATLILTGLSLLVGGIAAVAAIFAVRDSREQLKLARAQAEQRPHLGIELDLDLPKERGGPAFLVVKITNNGRVAATDIHGWISMEAAKLGPFVPPPRPPRERDPLFDVPYVSSPRPASRPTSGVIFPDDQVQRGDFYEAQLYHNKRLQPYAGKDFRIKVGIRASGRAKIGHRITYAEGSEPSGTVEVELPASTGF